MLYHILLIYINVGFMQENTFFKCLSESLHKYNICLCFLSITPVLWRFIQMKDTALAMTQLAYNWHLVQITSLPIF